jgi:hypothetical protein
VPFNFRLNLQQVFRRLGIQSGAKLPQLNDQVQMTMLVTDLSRLVPAPIEPRGLCGANVAEVVAQFSIVQLQALSAGGLFVETIILRGQVPALVDNYLLNVSNTNLGLALAPNINVGGTQILSRFTAGGDAVGAGGVPIPMPSGFQSITLPLGVFVPNQSFFSIQGPRIFIRLDVAMIYRELPSIEEVG